MMGMAPSAGSADSGLQTLLDLVTNPQAVKDRVATLQDEQAKLAEASAKHADAAAAAQKAQADAVTSQRCATAAQAALGKKAADVQAASDDAETQHITKMLALHSRESALVQ